MGTKLTASYLLAGNLLLAHAAHAQTSFSIGPKVGLTIATAHFSNDIGISEIKHRTGLEAGLLSSFSRGHIALQVAALYAQKGYVQHGIYEANMGGPQPVTVDESRHRRFNYISLPISLAYNLQESGEGLQVFAGPYVGLLLGGRTETTITVAGKKTVTRSDITPISGNAILRTPTPSASISAYKQARATATKTCCSSLVTAWAYITCRRVNPLTGHC